MNYLVVDEKIDVKIGTPTESLWTDVLKETNAQIESLKKALTIQEEISKLAQRIIDEEKQKFK